jgi:hypothetical protein
LEIYAARNTLHTYFLLGFIHLPPATSETIKQITAAHENAVIFVLMPMVRNTIPRISKYPDSLRRSIFMVTSLLFQTSANAVETANRIVARFARAKKGR